MNGKSVLDHLYFTVISAAIFTSSSLLFNRRSIVVADNEVGILNDSSNCEKNQSVKT
jgi:hypothetical protein